MSPEAGEVIDLVDTTWCDEERVFAAEAAHRLLNPLTGLRLRLEGLGSSGTLTTDQCEELERAVADVDRIHDELTALLRDRADRARRRAPRTDVRAVVDALVRRWEARRSPLGAVVVAPVVAEGVEVGLPAIAVACVLDRAVRATVGEGDGPVSIAVDAAESHVRFTLRTAGPFRDAPGLDEVVLMSLRDRVQAAGGRLERAADPDGLDVLLPRLGPSLD